MSENSQGEFKEILDQFSFKSELIISNLDDSEKKLVQSYFEPIQFKKGSKLFYEDGIPTGVFMIESGIAKKYKMLGQNQEQIFYIYTKNDLLGYHAVLSNERYQDTCEALENLNTQFISKENFLFLMEELPNFKSALIRNLAHEFGVLANTIAVLSQKVQVERFALSLLILESRYKQNDLSYTGIRISRNDLSNFIGVTRESLGRSIKEFREANLISVNLKNITILEHQKLFDILQMGKLKY